MSHSSSSTQPSVPRDCWYAMALASQIGSDPYSIPFVDGELVAYRQSDGTVIVLQASCAHRGCSLTGGWKSNQKIVCPYHGWQYDSDGHCVHIPSLRSDESIPSRAKIKSYQSQEKYGLIWVWIPGHYETPSYNIQDIPEVSLPKMTHQPDADLFYEFNTHFTRSIENGIDPTHAPFTHGKTIGKVDSSTDFSLPRYEIGVTDYSINAQMPIKVKKLSGISQYLLRGDEKDIYKSYRFVYPNLLLSLVNFGRFTLVSLQAHVPTGSKSTRMLSVNYRNFLRRRPILTSWFNRVTVKTGRQIAFEDDRIIMNQIPSAVKYTGSNELLVESDSILVYFRRLMRHHTSINTHN